MNKYFAMAIMTAGLAFGQATQGTAVGVTSGWVTIRAAGIPHAEAQLSHTGDFTFREEGKIILVLHREYHGDPIHEFMATLLVNTFIKGAPLKDWRDYNPEIHAK